MGAVPIRRDLDVARVERALSDATPAALLLHGEPGVGKTTVLATVARRSSRRVLRATAVPSEADLPFATLHLLLHGVLEAAPALSAPAREALEVAFGRTAGPSPAPMVLRSAVLDVLALARGDTGLLVVLDDVQWMDEASAAVLAYAVRRLPAQSAALLARRDHTGPDGPFDRLDLPAHELPPLDAAGAAMLLDTEHAGLRPALRRRVLEVAAGNPLALVELPRALEEAPWQDGDPLPLTRRLESSFGQRVTALEPPVRRSLLEAALDDGGAAVVDLHLEAAVETGLMTRSGGALAFRHPLVRSAVVAVASDEERRAAHRTLADRYTASLERRALHLAAAETGPNESVAALLEEAARQQVLRGAAAQAVGVLIRAAAASEDPTAASRRLGDAAFLAGQAGDLERSEALLRSAAARGDAGSPAEAITLGMLELFAEGAVRSAEPRLLTALAVARAQGDRAMADRVRSSVLSLAMFAADGAVHRRLRAAITEEPGSEPDPLIALYRDAWGDLTRAPADLPDRIRTALAGADLEPWTLMRLLVSAYYAGVLDEHRPLLDRMLAREAKAGARISAVVSGQVRLLDRMDSGAWAAARAEGESLRATALEHGLALLEHQTAAYLGLLAADQGRRGEALQLADDVERWAGPRGVGLVAEHASSIRARVALADGRYEDAFRALVAITPPGRFLPHRHLAARTLLDLVESAVHAGRTGQAREHALAAQRSSLPALGARYRLIVSGALAMTSTPTVAAREFERALHGAGAEALPFDAARIRMAFAACLRRDGDRAAAREQLAAAHAAFVSLGAAPWAERAAGGLRALGAAADAGGTDGLTPQEREIVALAATGLTNREIGERLHLSPRTVGSHLYRAFPKLGVRTRAGLRDAVGPLG